MSWQGIEGHDTNVEQFRCALDRDRLGSTFLFVGPPGIGKRLFARKLSQALLCQKRPIAALDPCGQCVGCLQVIAGTHPDQLLVAKPADKSNLPLELLIGAKERRMQEGLCHDIRLKPYMGGRRVAIIDDADTLNEEGANCLLKTLEEPPPQAVLILIGTSPDRQLPTIRSRSQIVRFRPLATEVIARLLVEQGVVEDPQQAERIAALSGGSMERAAEMADSAWWDFRRQFLEALGRPSLDSGAVARMVLAFVDAAGKEASARRGRLRIVLEIAVEFYREVARQLAGVPADSGAELAKSAANVSTALAGDCDAAVACVERTLEALAHVERNANQSTLVEAWLDDLVQRLVLGRPLVMDPAR